MREHEISSSVYYKWVEQYQRGRLDNEPTCEGELLNKIAKLEQKVGQLTMENDLLKKIRALWLPSHHQTTEKRRYEDKQKAGATPDARARFTVSTEEAVHAHVDLLKAHGCLISMSRKGNPYDNAKAESFMKTLKYEEVYLNEYETYEEIVHNVFGFMEQVYNAKRLHSALDYQAPNEFEEQWAA